MSLEETELENLRTRISDSNIPSRKVDENILIATWNIKNFGKNKNPRGIRYAAEICRHFDIVAIQEVKDSLEGLQKLQQFLGEDYRFIFTDPAGNNERLVYLYDTRRVRFTGLAAEIVLDPSHREMPSIQFNRTPFMVSFRTSSLDFILATVHIFFSDYMIREMEIRRLAQTIAARAEDQDVYDPDIIALGDFNIIRKDDRFYRALTEAGLVVDEKFDELKTNFSKNKHYDQIAYYNYPDKDIDFSTAGVVDFTDVVFTDLATNTEKYTGLSDHLPLWAEFHLNRLEPNFSQILNP